MEKIQQWRDGISWFIAAVTVALSYEIRNKGYIHIPKFGVEIIDDVLPAILAVILLLSSLLIARSISKWAISKEEIRALILGENHVEGFWFLQTDPQREDLEVDQIGESPLSPPGVLWLRYEPSWGQFAVTTTRLDKEGRAYQVPSKIINLRTEGQLLLYVNYFTVDNGGAHSTEGVSKGRFVKKGDFSKTKDQFDAYIFTEGEKTRHQWAEKISPGEMNENKLLAEQSGQKNWIQEFLRRKSHNLS